MHAPVSVIIPCYRCTDTIARAVQSVILQTLLPKEILLVEDCSDDGGVTLASLYRLQQNFQGKSRIIVIPLKVNSGPGEARNAGWDAASEAMIAFLDADDEWHPKKLDIQYGYMQQNPTVSVTGHQYVYANQSDQTVPALLETLTTKNISPRSLLFKNSFPTSSVMLKREIAFRFATGKRYSEDFYLWQQLACAGLIIVRIEVALVNYYKALYGAGGLSGKLWQMEKGELNNFVALRKAGSINWLLYVAASSFSVAKYIMRMAGVWFKQ